jgi:hypothetical protein
VSGPERKVLTFSQVKHLVSLVRTPSNSLWTKVAFCGEAPELVVVVAMVGGFLDTKVATESDTEDVYYVGMKTVGMDSHSSPTGGVTVPFSAAFLSSSISSTILLSR